MWCEINEKRQVAFLPFCMGTSLVAQMVKNPPAMRETHVQPLGQEDSLEKRMATHSSILAWEIPEDWNRQRSLAGYRSWAPKESDMTE